MDNKVDSELAELSRVGSHKLVTAASRLGAPGSSKELAEFKHRLGYLRLASVGAAAMHLLVTLVVMIMAFTPGTHGQFLSETLVICAFGCLNTCVFVLVETWKTLMGTSATTQDLPSWNWHNDSFMSSVANIFFLCLFSLPALVVYILHSLGQQFFEILPRLRTSDSEVFGLIVYHLLSGAGVFVFDTLTVIWTTTKLRSFQREPAEEGEGEEKENKEEKVGDQIQQADDEAEEQEEDQQDEDEVRPVEKADRTLAWVTLFAHLAFVVDLIALSNDNINSATLGSCIISGALLCVWVYYTVLSHQMTQISESWLLRFRLATIVHIFLFLIFFWVTLCVSIILQATTTGNGFFQTIQALADDDPVRAFLICILISFIFISSAIYAVILYVHSRSMWSLDEIASLSLAAKLQAKLKTERDE